MYLPGCPVKPSHHDGVVVTKTLENTENKAERPKPPPGGPRDPEETSKPVRREEAGYGIDV
jgi:hypothetical protein